MTNASNTRLVRLLQMSDNEDIQDLTQIVFGENTNPVARPIDAIVTELCYLGSNDFAYIIRKVIGKLLK